MLENNFCFLRRISSFLGVCFYSFIFPFPTYTYTQEWECKEKNSYSISAVEFVKQENKQKEKIKNYPKKFLEEKARDLKIFEVLYDEKGGGIINGSPFLIMIGNLEEEGKSSAEITTTKNADNEIIEEKSTYLTKNSQVPITFYSISENLEETVGQNNGFFNKNFEEYTIATYKEFFTIWDILSDTPEFSLMKISNIDVSNSIIDSNDNETYTLDLSELIQLSKGKCVVKSRK